MEDLMREAIEIARPTRPHPNPRVGALVLHSNGTVVGRGAHLGPGDSHAEVRALIQAGAAARGGTLVVTLEPCSHHGHTPPCTDSIIEAGIVRVVAATTDPDSNVNGKGFARLREAGIEVETGVLEAEAENLDPGYFHHRRTGLPRVTLKLASTLDGAVAALDGTSQWITSPDARADAHSLRAQSDAVMVGAGTVIDDDPALTVRHGEVAGPQPMPVVIAGRREISPRSQVFERPTIVFSPDHRELPGEVIVLPGLGGVDLKKALGMLGERGILDVLVEGGPRLARSLLEGGLVQQGVFYLGSKLAGGSGLSAFSGSFDTLSAARDVQITKTSLVGSDVRIEFDVGDGA